jgi:hypothetical protein
MNSYDVTSKEIVNLARGLRDLQQQAARQYKPVVDGILRTHSRDIRHIENTLDCLLDFCGHAPVLRMYKILCRYYWDIDAVATADYIHAYRERWDAEGAKPRSAARCVREARNVSFKPLAGTAARRGCR